MLRWVGAIHLVALFISISTQLGFADYLWTIAWGRGRRRGWRYWYGRSRWRIYRVLSTNVPAGDTLQIPAASSLNLAELKSIRSSIPKIVTTGLVIRGAERWAGTKINGRVRAVTLVALLQF